MLVNKEKISKQRSVLGYIFKNLGSNLIKGKSLMNISFPIYVFEPISLLQRFANSLGYAPILLEQAGNMKKPYEQFEKVILIIFVENINENIMKI